MGLVVSMAALAAACVGDSPEAVEPIDLPESSDAAGNASSSSGASIEAGAGSTADACVAGCTGDTFTTCTAAPVACPLGCIEAIGCRELDPPGSLVADDLRAVTEDADLGATFTVDEAMIPLVFDSETGRIVRPAVTRGGGLPELVVRAANTNPESSELISGIRFELRADLGVFSARNMTVRNARIIGTRPVAFVAAEQLRVLGRIEATCGQVGGFAGGYGVGQSGAGAGGGGGGKGAPTVAASGGGGGGHGGAGGAGGAGVSGGTQVPGGAAGPVRSELILLGGAGGGGAGNVTTKQRGGAGGGVIVLAAGSAIVLGDDLTTKWFPPEAPSALDLNKGLDVSGCGGTGGPGSSQASAAGGGAGGLAWLEAPSVAIRSSAGIAANGGGGGGTVSAGARGSLADTPAAGGTASGGYTCAIAAGGAGAAGVKTTGGNGTRQDHTSCTMNNVGSGGGGGGGRILVRTRAGGIEPFTGLASPKPLLELGQL